MNIARKLIYLVFLGSLLYELGPQAQLEIFRSWGGITNYAAHLVAVLVQALAGLRLVQYVRTRSLEPPPLFRHVFLLSGGFIALVFVVIPQAAMLVALVSDQLGFGVMLWLGALLHVNTIYYACMAIAAVVILVCEGSALLNVLPSRTPKV